MKDNKIIGDLKGKPGKRTENDFMYGIGESIEN
jgi:hypothetical protein